MRNEKIKKNRYQQMRNGQNSLETYVIVALILGEARRREQKRVMIYFGVQGRCSLVGIFLDEFLVFYSILDFALIWKEVICFNVRSPIVVIL